MPYVTAEGRTIHAAYYRLTDGRGLVVWFDERGNHDKGHTVAKNGKPILFAKAGDVIVFKGEEMTIASVEEYPHK